MKESDSLELSWKFDLALRVPIRRKQAARIANRVLVTACVITLTLALAPLLGVL